MSKVPTKEGFYWGIHRIDDGAEEGKDFNQDNKEWEVMHVVLSDDTTLMAMVPGVAKWQALDAFVWGEECHRTGGKEVRAYVQAADALSQGVRSAIQERRLTFALGELQTTFDKARIAWPGRPS